MDLIMDLVMDLVLGERVGVLERAREGAAGGVSVACLDRRVERGVDAVKSVMIEINEEEMRGMSLLFNEFGKDLAVECI